MTFPNPIFDPVVINNDCFTSYITRIHWLWLVWDVSYGVSSIDPRRHLTDAVQQPSTCTVMFGSINLFSFDIFLDFDHKRVVRNIPN